MTDAVLLEKVKTGLGISGNYHDELLQIYIDDFQWFMLDAGVPQSVVNSAAAVGCILSGVNDLWNYSGGGTKFSDYTIKRVIQLTSYKFSHKAISTLRLDIPTAETAALYGWHLSAAGLAYNITAGEFTVSDEETITAKVFYPNGTEATATNDGTGNSRTLQIGEGAITVLTDTIYDIEQSRFVSGAGNTAFSVSDNLYGATIELSTYIKAV